MRKANNIEEKSVIDFVLVSLDLIPSVSSMVIDEERQYALNWIRKENGKKIITESDHNPIITEFNLSIKNKERVDRIELFNYKNKECQDKF